MELNIKKLIYISINISNPDVACCKQLYQAGVTILNVQNQIYKIECKELNFSNPAVACCKQPHQAEVAISNIQN